MCEFTHRHKEVFSRWLDMNKEEFKKDLKLSIEKAKSKGYFNDTEYDESYTFRGISLQVRTHLTFDDNDEPNFDEMYHLMDFSYWDNDIKKRFNINPLLTLDFDLTELVKTYEICICENDFTIKDGFCRYCYPLARDSGDKCAICMDNSVAKWIKTDCGHVFHYHCWNKIERVNKGQADEYRKCPLCRTHIKSSNYDDY
jgi:hypothetical protein